MVTLQVLYVPAAKGGEVLGTLDLISPANTPTAHCGSATGGGAGAGAGAGDAHPESNAEFKFILPSVPRPGGLSFSLYAQASCGS